MAEHDRLTFAPILVKDFGAVRGRDRGHGSSPVTSWLRARALACARNCEAQLWSILLRSRRLHAGRKRRNAPMIISTKNTSTMPCTTPNTGPDGGTLGASACSAGTLRNDWIA